MLGTGFCAEEVGYFDSWCFGCAIDETSQTCEDLIKQITGRGGGVGLPGIFVEEETSIIMGSD